MSIYHTALSLLLGEDLYTWRGAPSLATFLLTGEPLTRDVVPRPRLPRVLSEDEYLACLGFDAVDLPRARQKAAAWLPRLSRVADFASLARFVWDEVKSAHDVLALAVLVTAVLLTMSEAEEPLVRDVGRVVLARLCARFGLDPVRDSAHDFVRAVARVVAFQLLV